MRIVSDGIDQCTVGHLSPAYNNILDHLDGRLGQIIELFSESTSPNKIAHDAENKGVAIAVLVDRYVPGDGAINRLLDVYDSEEEGDENE